MNPKIFSSVAGLGRVYQCPSCEDIHLSIGPVDLRVSAATFQGVVELVNKASEEMRTKEISVDIPPGVTWTPQPWSLC